MAFTNNIMIVRHKLLTELVKLWKNGELTTDKIDRLPLELSPRRQNMPDVAAYIKNALCGNINHSLCWDWIWTMKQMNLLHYPNMPPEPSTVQKMECPRTI